MTASGVAGDFVEQVHGGWQHGQHGGGGDAGRDGSDYVEQPELGSCDAVEHAGCGRRRGREQWEVCGDGIGRVAGDFVEQVHGGWRHGQHGGGGDAGRDGSDYVEQPELGSCDAVEHAGCGRRRGREQWEVCGDGIGRVAAISSNKFTVAGNTGNTVVAGTLDVTGATTLSSLSSGAATLSSTLDVAGDVDVNRSLR